MDSHAIKFILDQACMRTMRINMGIITLVSVLFFNNSYAAPCYTGEPGGDIWHPPSASGISKFYFASSTYSCASLTPLLVCGRWYVKAKESQIDNNPNITSYTGPRLVEFSSENFSCEFNVEVIHDPGTIYTSSVAIGPGGPDTYFAIAKESLRASECEANPCDVISGRKIQSETDVDSNLLQLRRFYSSSALEPGTLMGANWRHSFESSMDDALPKSVNLNAVLAPITPFSPVDRSDNYATEELACESGWLDIKDTYRRGILVNAVANLNSNGVCQLMDNGVVVGYLTIIGPDRWKQIQGAALQSKTHTVTRPNGTLYKFEEITTGIFEEIYGARVKLVKDGNQWLFYDQDNVIERFEDGKLLSRTLPNGQIITMGYDAEGRLETATGPFGNTLQFSYNSNGQIDTLTHPPGQISYGYDANHNLISVTYEDGKVRQYHYEDTTLVNHLTGITDERGIRYSTWAYDVEGRAISSKHAGDVDLTTFTYNPASTVVNDAAGGTREYHLTNVGRQMKVSHVTGDHCSDCYWGGMKQRTYDVNGFLDEATDWEGNVTDYDHNARGLEIQRIEAKNTPQERTITTQWHTDFRLPAKITEPERVIDFTYDSDGNLLERKETPRAP